MIYKYMHQDRTEFFTNCQLRFTQPRFLNDRAEVRPRLHYDDPAAYIARHVARNSGADTRNEIVIRNGIDRKSARKAQRRAQRGVERDFWANQDKWLKRDLDIFMKHVNIHVGVLSLTRSCNNVLMWAHYSGSGKGYVIGLDESSPFFSPLSNDRGGTGKLTPVDYSADVVEVPILQGALDIPESIFYRKKPAWGYEEELRIIRDPERADASHGDIFLWTVPDAAIKEIILGYDSDVGLNQAASAFCSAKSIPLRRAAIDSDNDVKVS